MKRSGETSIDSLVMIPETWYSRTGEGDGLDMRRDTAFSGVLNVGAVKYENYDYIKFIDKINKAVN